LRSEFCRGLVRSHDGEGALSEESKRTYLATSDEDC